MTSDVYVQLINFPTTTKEAVTQNEDGSYTIFINAKLGHDEQLKAYEHAMNHIKQNDFDKFDVQQIEYEAHNTTCDKLPAVSVPTIRYTHEQFLKRIQADHKKVEKQLQAYEDRRKYLEATGHYYKDPDLISGLDNY